MPDTDATKTMVPPPFAFIAAAELHGEEGVAQHDVEVPVPVFVGHLNNVRVPGHADDVDDAVDAAEVACRVPEHALDVVPFVRVTRDRDAVDLGRDVGGEVGLDVDARDARAHRREGVRRLAADALAGAEHHEAAPVEPQQPRVVGHERVVGAGHA